MLAPALAISLGACSSSTSTPLSTAGSGGTRVGSTAGPGSSPSTSATATSGSASTSSGTSGAATASATSAAGWALLPAQVPNGQSVTGWVVFRVEPRNAPKMVVDYTRPTSQVTDSGTIFPTQTFGAPIVG